MSFANVRKDFAWYYWYMTGLISMLMTDTIEQLPTIGVACQTG